MAHPHAHARAHHQAKAHAMVKRAGYKSGGAVHGDKEADAKMVASGVHQHEDHEHGGKHAKLHLAHGGHVDGEACKPHMAKRARGGRTGHTKVNVIVAPQGGGGARPVPVPVGGGGLPAAPPRPMGAPAAALPMMPPQAQRPPMGMGPPGAPPMGGGPMGGAPMLRKRGGRVHGKATSHRPDRKRRSDEEYNQKYQPDRENRARGGKVPHMEGGAGSGVGRTEKPHEYGGSRGFKPHRVSP